MEIRIIDGFAILEYPAESFWTFWDSNAASIWKLPIVLAILALPNVQKIRFSQGLLDAYATKPTNLMVANLPQLMLDLPSAKTPTAVGEPLG